MINNWTRRMMFSSSHEHYIDAIMEGDKFIIECSCLSDWVIKRLIDTHNEAMEQTYKKGLNEGVEIAKDVYKGEK